MIDEPKKHCYGCDTDFPATEEYFYPSYLRNGKNQCKSCHAKGEHTHVSFRDKLKEIAHHVERDEASSYQSLNSVAKNIGCSVAKVERDVYENKLPVFEFTYNNVGPALALKREDAEVYIAVHSSNGHSQPQAEIELLITNPTVEAELPRETTRTEGEPLIAGTPNECASCETTRGNIIAVLDEKKEIRAYLCSTCYRTGSSYKWEPKRMRRMADIIERIGIQRFMV